MRPALAPADAAAADAGLPAWRGRHAGETIVVCGCGASLAELPHEPGCVTIGVNDVGRHLDPTYLVVVNPPRQFRGDRFAAVRHSRARALFTQLDLGPVAPPVVRIRFGRHGGTEDLPDALHHTQNSPYVALSLAAYMGARRIGLIGVDFTEDHFFGATGRHPLAARLAQIDAEYGAYAQALAGRGVELVNLSARSRLQSLPRAPLASFLAPQAAPAAAVRPRRVFVVTYRFQTVGSVFDTGLRHAAAALGVAHAEADCDDPRLPERVAAFAPDLLLVVHGRRFAQRWGRHFAGLHKAVWLVDEPYEVDDTASWSACFDTVFVNDPATLARHRNAHSLPMAFDPDVHRDAGLARVHAVGFVGGANPARERCLLPLAEAGLLSYVVGGPWRAPALRRLSLGSVVPPDETARLYQQTRIVLNVFRERHHFNAAGTAGTSMNPRIVEALACGALVVSERRAGIAGVFPALPQFDTPEALLPLVRGLLAEPQRLDALRADCHARLAGHGYADRLAQALRLVAPAPATAPVPVPAPALAGAPAPAPPARAQVLPFVPAPRPAEPLLLQPFARTPRRHLLYHLWPVRGSTWRWNVAQLLRRIDLFNGRRLVGIVTDARSEDADTVLQAFAGHGCDCTVLPNDARGESATFPRLLEQLQHTDPDDVSFYAHAKGVKYEPAFPPAVRRWAEAQYQVLLDHWPPVREQLERHAMTGMLRRPGRYANHQHVGDWHYSGTFFWFRHGPVFSRRWAEVPPFYGGVEAWPGMLFRQQEAGCLLLDQLRELPYQERFWKTRGDPAVAQWRQRQRGVPVPPDLAHPPPFEGHALPRLEQRPAEFAWWLDRLQALGARHLLVIGPQQDGVGWHAARRFAARGLPLRVTTLASGAAAPAGAQVDAAFVDGDHGYAACRRDVDLAFALGAREVALHDIVDSDWHAQAHCAVSRVWDELRRSHDTDERVGADWGGIGIARRMR